MARNGSNRHLLNSHLLNRRAMLQSGAAAVGLLALAGAGKAALAAPPAAGGRRGPLVGWMVLQANGGGRIDVFETDARLLPVRHLAAEEIAAMPLAGASRHAAALLRRVAAASWNVAGKECELRAGRLLHPPSGRSMPAAIWVDFG